MGGEGRGSIYSTHDPFMSHHIRLQLILLDSVEYPSALIHRERDDSWNFVN